MRNQNDLNQLLTMRVYTVFKIVDKIEIFTKNFFQEFLKNSKNIQIFVVLPYLFYHQYEIFNIFSSKEISIKSDTLIMRNFRNFHPNNIILSHFLETIHFVIIVENQIQIFDHMFLEFFLILLQNFLDILFNRRNF